MSDDNEYYESQQNILFASAEGKEEHHVAFFHQALQRSREQAHEDNFQWSFGYSKSQWALNAVRKIKKMLRWAQLLCVVLLQCQIPATG